MTARTMYYVRMRSEEGNRYGYVVRLASGSWDISSRSFATLFDSRADAERFISEQTPSRRAKLSIVSARISNPMSTREKVTAYIRSIRNEPKKEYAERYAKWMMSGQNGEEPEKGKLSYMGAQAVRMNLWEILGEPRESNPIHRARDPIVFEHGDYYVTRNSKGHFEVWEMGATVATRVAYIGYEGQKGLDRVKAEVERREREHNPIRRARNSNPLFGPQWASYHHGTNTCEGNERMCKKLAPDAHYVRNPLSRGESWFVVLMKRPDGEQLYLTASGKGEYWMQNAKLFKSEADARKAVGKILRKHPGSRESGFEVKRIV